MIKTRLPFFYDYVFPSTILPNASPIEQSIVNMIATQYSNKPRTETFLEMDIDSDHSYFRRLFGDNMGHMPQSLRWGGPFLGQRCFHNRVEILENSVYFGKLNMHKQGYRRYIYPIKATLHFPRFTGTDEVGSKLNGEFFWKHISEEVLQDVRSDNAIIFLDWSNENFIDQADYANLHYAISYGGLPKKNIILAVNSFNAQQIYESWFTPEQQLLQVRNLPYLINQVSWYYASNPDIMISEERFKASRDTFRPNYFMYPSRRGRDHRWAMLFKFATDGLLEKADWSSLENVSFDSAFARASVFDLGFDKETCRKWYSLVPKSLQKEGGSTYDTVAGWNDRHSESNINSYFYVTGETYVHGQYRSLTEKGFKAIANYNPFLIVGFPGILEELRRLGFKTFSGWIDESYDRETDTTKRMSMIAAEVRRLCSMSKEEIHAWYWQMEEVLIHNHNRLMNLYLTDENSQGFIEYLHHRVRNP